VRVVEEIHTRITFISPDAGPLLQSLLQNLQTHEQRQFLDQTFKVLSRSCLPLTSPPDFDDALTETPSSIAAASATIAELIGSSEAMRAHLETWLSDPTMNASESFGMRRAAVSAFAHASNGAANMLEDPVQDLMEKTMKRFGDNLFVKHSPILQQEACAQTLLLLAGYAHRAQPMSLFIIARSSAHLNGMSNRLNSSSPRARFLGMVVGMAISDLVDKPGSKMNFDIDDLKTPEAKWYQRLVKVDDKIGGFKDIKEAFGIKELRKLDSATTSESRPTKKPTQLKPQPRPTIQEEPPITRIMEVLDDSEEDDDLVPYGKPDSDPEDEDEDPTMINRDKPKAPVYIRDLMAGLNDSENYDKHSLALKSAAALIRRKTSFGKEVSDHALELASILVGLGDTFDMEDFLELRLQALIAVLVSSPAQMAPWFARQVFDGDYSLSQRTTVLSVLGLGARELAGYKDEDEELNPKLAATSFPSKQLPERLHKMYTAERNAPVALIASKLERSMIQPMALDAADKMSGPNVLKVRTFSSRMEVEKKRKKVIPNALAKIVAEGFFFPLTGRWWQNLQAYGAENVHFQPFLLSTYLKTLSLILHAAGSGTISLPQMTAEFWELILSVRTNALADVSVLEAVLFATLTLLDMNEDKRRLAEEHSKQLIETQEWVELVFDRVGGGDEEGERIRMLAASVLMKTREVVDKYQRLLVGDLVDY
jgi:telomere length regulation protein